MERVPPIVNWELKFFFSYIILNLQVFRPFLILRGAKVVEIGHINNIGSIIIQKQSIL